LVRSAFPHQKPAETIERWLMELAKIDRIQAWVADASHVANRGRSPILDLDLDAASVQIIKYLLDGCQKPRCPSD
jgi:hypothetical protein